MKITFQEVLQQCEIAKGNSFLGKINSEYPPKVGVLYRGHSQDIVVAVDLSLVEYAGKYYLLHLLHVHQKSRISYMENGYDWADNFWHLIIKIL